MKLIANEITDSIVKVLKNARWEEKAELKVVSKYVNAVRRQPSPELLKWAKERVRTTDLTKMGTADKASDDIKTLYALDIVKFDFYEPQSYDLFIQAVRIGEGAVGTLPAEIFAETGLNLKNRSPFKFYFTITHANGQYGYVPPKSQFLLGGYETWLCSGSFLEIDAEEKLTDDLTELVRTLH
jgi:hypothetical protein